MWIARDKNGKLFIHPTEPRRATYGRGVDDSFWETEEFGKDEKREASEFEYRLFNKIQWGDEPINISRIPSPPPQPKYINETPPPVLKFPIKSVIPKEPNIIDKIKEKIAKIKDKLC